MSPKAKATEAVKNLEIWTMKSLAQWIQSHQIPAFFLFTLVISWGLWFAPGAVYQRGQDLLAPLAIVAACGPALAGILITALSNTEPKRGKRRTFWIAFLVAWALSTLVYLGHNILFGPTQLSPVVIAKVVAGIAHAAANTAFAFIFLETNLVWWVAALALILVDRMWEKLPEGHPAVWRPPSIPAQQLAGVP